MNTTLNRETAPARAASQETTTACVSSTTPILPAKPARVKRPYSPNPTEQPDGTWLCESERYAGFIQYIVYVDSDGGIHCNCEAGRWDRPCKHAASVHALLHPPVVEVAPVVMPRLDWQTCPRCGAVAWMPAGWECSCAPVPTPVVMPAEEQECCDAEEAPRVVDLGTGWSFKPATADLMEAMGW